MSRREKGGGGIPALVRFVLRLLLPEREREFYLGDLEESGRRTWIREIWGAAALRLSPRPPRGRGPMGGGSGYGWSHTASDLRLGIRRLVRTPAATLSVLIALSLGIGLSTLMFSLVDGVLLPTLPFENGERIVRFARGDESAFSVASIEHWRERQTSLEGLSVTVQRMASVAVDGDGTEPMRAAALEVGALGLLSAQPALGRAFTEADAGEGAAAVALVGHELWRTRLGADPSALGRTIRLNGVPTEIVGVMPVGFGFPFDHEIWTPLRLDALRPDHNPERLAIFGVVRDGIDLQAAAAELNALEAQRSRADTEPALAPIEIVSYTNIMNPAEMSFVLAGIMLSVAFLVLLVACANAANVLLARAAVRGREVAVRTALGASRMRILAQFWVEVALLALAGGVVGTLLAVASLRLMRRMMAAVDGAPFWIHMRVDVSVLAFVVVAAAAAAMLAGLAPALHASRANRSELLKDASRGASSHRLGAMMGRLVVAELAVSVVLLAAAGLFVRSAVNLETYDFAFAPEGVYTAHVQLPESVGEDAGVATAFVAALEAALADLPGASSVALATTLPGVGGGRRALAVDGVHDPGAPELPRAVCVAVTPTFFETFRAPVLAGRGFDSGDHAGALPVAIVTETFEREHMPEGALGRRVALPEPGSRAEWLTVVGVVPDLMAAGLSREKDIAVYRPIAQTAPRSFMLAIRSDGAPAAWAEPIRETVQRLDRDVALFSMRPLDESIDLANAQYAWMSALFLVAGGLALFLAAVGLYGVMAFWVAQRTREIGVRMAVGGARVSIVGLVVRQGMMRIALGLAVGSALAVPVARALEGVLLDVRAFDPLVLGSVVGVLLAVGWLGCALPAFRATRVDPQAALTSE